MTAIAICFFGITRSLTWTAGSILENVIEPARQIGDVHVFGHFYRLSQLVNPRSGEAGRIVDDEDSLLPFDEVLWEDRETAIDPALYDRVRQHGDAWGDEGTSLRNLMLQLRSIKAVTARARAVDPDIVMFCRPDLEYHDSLSRPLRAICAARGPCAAVPLWQSWGGMNDRFALTKGQRAMTAYGERFDRVIEFCETRSEPLHSERLVKFALRGIPVTRFRERASRVRVGGLRKPESFDGPIMAPLRAASWRLVGGSVIEEPLRRAVRRIRRAVTQGARRD